MDISKVIEIAVAMIGVVTFPMVAAANTYTLTAEDQQIVFETAPELGYVVRDNFRSPYLQVIINGRQSHVGIPPELVIRAKPGVAMEEIDALCRSMNLAIIKPMEFTTQEYLLEVLGSDVDAVFTAVDTLSAQSVVEWAWPNILYKPILSGQAPTGSLILDKRVFSGVQIRVANSPGRVS